jgi:ABC-type branched-subunit amino acid transport system substrate-binding protein
MDYFLRTVAPDTVATEVMLDLIIELRWNMVIVLYVDNEFGHYAADCFRAAIRKSKTKTCIAYDEKFSEGSGPREIERVVQGR